MLQKPRELAPWVSSARRMPTEQVPWALTEFQTLLLCRTIASMNLVAHASRFLTIRIPYITLTNVGVVERTLACFSHFRRIRMCYERTGEHFQAFHDLAACCLVFNRIKRYFP